MSSPAPPQEVPPVASWRLLSLLVVSLFINYLDRGNLSMAAALLKDELHLSASQLGLLLGAFFWTYTACQIPVGWLVDRVNVGWVLALGFLLWSLATTATGLLHGFAALVAIRLLLGIGESVAWPAYCKILSRHFRGRLGFANASLYGAQICGLAFATFAGGLLINRFGWRPFFIFLGLVSLLWLPPWIRWRPADEPASHTETRDYRVILEILKQRCAWGTFVGLFTGNSLQYLLLTWLPFYLVHEHHFSLTTAAKVSGAAFLLVAAFAIASGKMSDRFISSGANPTLVRKAFLCIGFILAGVFLVLSALTVANTSVVLLLAASACMGISQPHNPAVAQILAGPQRAGTWFGLQNFCGNLAGIIIPPLTGFLVDRTGHFFWAFLIIAAIAWSGTLSWLTLVGRVEPIPWPAATEPLPVGRLAASASVGVQHARPRFGDTK